MNNKRNCCTILICTILFFCSFFLVFFVLNNIPDETWRIFSTTVISTFGAAALVNVLWELFAKISFTEYLLDLVRISNNISKSGLDTVYINFVDIQWDAELHRSKNLTAVFTYAETWRKSNRFYLERFLKENKHNSMTIIVPDPENSVIMDEFDRRFNYEVGETKRKIEDCIDFFIKMNASVYLYNDSIQASYYLLDDIAFMSFFNHEKTQGDVPALRVDKSGNMYNYTQREINCILRSSEKVVSFEKKLDENSHRKVIMEISK